MSTAVTVLPIRNDDDLTSALDRIEQLFFAEQGTADADERDVLATLVQAYESEHYPVAPPTAIDALEGWMDRQGKTRNDLIPYLDSQSRVSDVLRGKRGLSLSMIRRLHNELGIPLESLVG